MTTERPLVARCSIYEDRPQMCVDYPVVDSYIPPECTFTFAGRERHGECACDVGACCAIPRQDGEPGGAPMPSISGGQPCKYLVWVEGDEPMIKAASHPALPVVQPSLHELVRGPSDS